MVPAIHVEVAAQRAEELRRIGARHRLARAARATAGRSPRERLGRRLVATGTWPAGEPAAFVGPSGARSR
jgi:hypothetical protein